MTFKPSKQQADFFKWVTNGTGSCILEAVAGSGKTTTIIEGLKLMKGDVFFGAYNKNIADEIKLKVAKLNLPNVNVSTMHSAGFSAWRKVAKFVKVDSNKCRDIFRSIVPAEHNELMGAVLNLVSYIKQSALGVNKPITNNDLYNLIDHFNVDTLDQDSLVLDFTKKVFDESIKQDYKIIDFDDMVSCPLYHKCKVKEYDFVCVDEIQDLNHSRRLLALLMLKRGGRFIGVGDSFQAIYQFSGADSDSMNLMAESVSAVRFPLSVTYRCPKNVVALAQQYVPHITAHESAIDGVVTYLKDEDDITTLVGDAVLCRFNAPIITLAYQLIAKGIPSKVLGREIGTNLKALANRWKVKTFNTLKDRLETYLQKETTKLRIKEKEGLAVALEDKVRCLNILIKRIEEAEPKCLTPITRLCEDIDKLFGDNLGDNTQKQRCGISQSILHPRFF